MILVPPVVYAIYALINVYFIQYFNQLEIYTNLFKSHYPQRGEGGGRRPPTERRRGPEGTEETEQSLKESEEIQIL